MADSDNLTAIIKLLDDSILTVQIATNQIAEDLNLRINQIIGLYGTASWNTLLKIEKFQTESISPFSELNENGEKRTILECLEGLSSKQWNKVDPDKFVQNLRD